MKKYPVSYEEWGCANHTNIILPKEMWGLYMWKDIHPTTRTCRENYKVYVSFLALHLSKLGKLLQGVDDV